MNGVDEFDALDEGTLHRALRLEADERPPRLDATALVVAAGRHTGQERLRRALRGLALIGVSLGIESLVAIAAFNLLETIDLSAPLGLVLDGVAAVAQQLVTIGALTASPAVALAALAAVIFATIFERNNGRESINVRAS